ncbi:transposase [Chryseobacterium sp. SL1]|uniref:transposase n=1 Tax=Chryseobacterium sp. SL1 TaxID=2995159 RepID=UPI002272D51E|nr:transposase [Chryseobacterium sp. SL1]MCY1660207.1 transposase [Chryseobacterium sp. SL1]
MNYKKIHIGSLIEKRVKDLKISTNRICTFFKCSKEEVQNIYLSENISVDNLLKWSKLLKYDFFRLYSQHLILYSPPTRADEIIHSKVMKTSLPEFRKNLYTQEIIDFVLELIESKEKTCQQIIDDYRIPKTTLYKWISKYKEKID